MIWDDVRRGPNVPCAYPGCARKLLRSKGRSRPQWCSPEHREMTEWRECLSCLAWWVGDSHDEIACTCPPGSEPEFRFHAADPSPV